MYSTQTTAFLLNREVRTFTLSLVWWFQEFGVVIGVLSIEVLGDPDVSLFTGKRCVEGNTCPRTRVVMHRPSN